MSSPLSSSSSSSSNANDSIASKSPEMPASQQTDQQNVVHASESDKTCVVCFKIVDIFSIGECDHPVCYECSTSMLLSISSQHVTEYSVWIFRHSCHSLLYVLLIPQTNKFFLQECEFSASKMNAPFVVVSIKRWFLHRKSYRTENSTKRIARAFMIKHFVFVLPVNVRKMHFDDYWNTGAISKCASAQNKTTFHLFGWSIYRFFHGISTDAMKDLLIQPLNSRNIYGKPMNSSIVIFVWNTWRYAASFCWWCQENDLNICIRLHIQIFSFERRAYTREQLAMHRRKGDPDNKSHRGHPLCKYCDERYLDMDELFRHMRKEHYFCHFCDADGANQFYA